MKSIVGKKIDFERVKHYMNYSLSSLCDEERIYLSKLICNEFTITANSITLENYGSNKFKCQYTNTLNQIDVRIIFK